MNVGDHKVSTLWFMLIGFSEYCLRKELAVPQLQLYSVIEQAANTVMAWQEMIVPYESVFYHY
jgi:arginine exporter protein ArgO